MKRLYLLLFMAVATGAARAQVMKVNMGEVAYCHPAEAVGDMPFAAGGQQLSVQGKTYDLAAVDSITFNSGTVAAGTIAVEYSGTTARVTVAGDLARYVDISAVGADVRVVVDSLYTQPVAYVLSGSSADGSFYMDGENQATVSLNALTLTNTRGGAITIDDGKKITLNLTGATTLADGAGGTQRACCFINGHVVLEGTGSLTITGNTRHGYFSDEYTEMNSGTLNVLGAVSDGLHINQYFRLNGGNVTVTAQGDGLDVGKKPKITEGDNGMIFINGGSIDVTSTGAGYKGIKADSTIAITNGNVTSTVTGTAVYDATLADITSSAALKPGAGLTIGGGNVTLTARGNGGKGINAGADINITGGTVKVTTYGNLFAAGALDTKPQAVKTDGNITIAGGEIYALAQSADARSFSTDFQFLINGGTVLGISGKRSEPTGGSQAYQTFRGQNIAAGQTVTFGGVSYTVPADFSNASARVLSSK